MNVNVKKVIILGAGISGLSLAYFLSKRKDLDVLVLEKEERAGGVIQSTLSQGFLFEQGPHIFKTSKSLHLLQLAQELEVKILPSSKSAKERYVWRRGALRPFPVHPLALFSSPLTRPLLFSLLSEWKRPQFSGDESVWDFVSRRFGQKVAEEIVDPLLMGIWAGDIHKLSIHSCFPRLKEWEEEFGSVTKGFMRTRSKRAKEPFSFFTFEGGAEAICQALLQKLQGKVFFGQRAEKIVYSPQEVAVETEDKTWRGDFLFCALPAHEAGRLCSPLDAPLGKMLSSIPSKSLKLVNVGYTLPLLEQKGYGYVVPTLEREKIYGAVFHSNLFRTDDRTRLTLLAPIETSPEEAFQAAARHLGLSSPPDHSAVKERPLAIPQYEVGHAEKIARLETFLGTHFPRLRLLGNYLHGTSVDACIHHSLLTSQQLSLRV